MATMRRSQNRAVDGRALCLGSPDGEGSVVSGAVVELVTFTS